MANFSAEDVVEHARQARRNRQPVWTNPFHGERADLWRKAWRRAHDRLRDASDEVELGHVSSVTAAQFDTPTDVGSRLRAAREAKQLSLREIADTTKISVSALEALEENDVARLPGGIFTRGFVRSYAAEVGLDSEQTMRDFMAQLPADEVAGGTEYDDRPHEHDLSESPQRKAGTVRTLVLVGVAVAALLFFFWIWGVPSGTGTPVEPPGPPRALRSGPTVPGAAARR